MSAEHRGNSLLRKDIASPRTKEADCGWDVKNEVRSMAVARGSSHTREGLFSHGQE